MILRFFISLFILSGILKAQVVPTNDSARLLQKRVLSIEIANIGASMPYFGFGNHEKSMDGGFAIPGIKIDAGLNIQLYKHLGIKSMLLYQNNQIDEYKYKKDLMMEDPANSYTISSGGWNNTSLMIGSFGNFNFGKTCHLQPYILGGFNYGISPNIDLILSDSLKMISDIKQKRGNALAFCISAGMDLKADLENDFQFVVGVNFFYSALKFNKIRLENSYKNSIYDFPVYQPVQTFGLKIGIAKILR
ncbi:MAG: hypothetical protein SGJ15_06785 [Bacteroidota bacterium]|nr:hypothetical protein [Bacteroidota bacterium]